MQPARDTAVQDGEGLPLARVMGQAPGVGLQALGVGKARPVIAGLGEHPGAGERAGLWG